jgi:phosphatidylinositol alpha-1,6-mannosyltransferase
VAGFNIHKTPVSVIHYGVDHETFRPDLDAEFLKIKYGTRRKKVLLTVAELRRRKGIDQVLSALKLLGDKAKDIVYVIVGEGEDRERLQALAAEYGLAGQVLFTGAVSDKDLPFHYAICDAYVMPNREEKNGDLEGFGITFIEAQAAEKAVIGGESGGVPDSIVDGKTGLLCPPGDAEALSAKIRRILENPKEAEELGRNGRARAISLFTWPLIMNKTEMVYEKVFERAKR